MIILVGESASGKSSIEKDLVKYGYDKIVSYTTRPIRQGEVDGVDYHYVTDDCFKDLLKSGFFAENTIYNNWNYGIAKGDCTDNKVVVVEPNGFLQLLKMKDLNITSFYIKVDERKRLARMVNRGDDIMELFRRIISDQGVFQWVENEVTHVIDNNDFYGTRDILKILKK